MDNWKTISFVVYVKSLHWERIREAFCYSHTSTLVDTQATEKVGFGAFLFRSICRFSPSISREHCYFVKTPFFSFCYLSFFRYKTCTGCLEQQQKYNIQIYMQFPLFNNQLVRWILLEFPFLLIVPRLQSPKWPEVLLLAMSMGEVQINT